MSFFFIRRPIVAMVIAILTVLVGVVVMRSLPVEQYPDLAPPTVNVSAYYPGANAETVEASVATPIEQEVNGVDNMLYMRSINGSDGRMSLNVTFKVGTDLDVANTLTQNRVAQAQSRLPEEVIQQGITIKKVNPSILMVVSIFSPNNTYDALFLNNYAVLSVKDALLRVGGVSEVNLAGGAEYGMRIWLRPDQLAKLGLTSADVIHAIREQNLQAPAGQVGAAPSAAGQEFTYTVQAPGRLTTSEEFGNIIVRSTDEGQQVRVKDVARVELGGETYRTFGRHNGQAAGVLLIYLAPGANQMASANGIYARLEELKRFFPADVDYGISYDTTPAVSASIAEIIKTLFAAVALVVLVTFVFLQDWRATLIPTLAIPVSLIGTFIFFPIFGFTMNTLTMFGLVLAIGIVVDDAIVVTEAVMHQIEKGLSPHDATVQAMKEVSGPVIGMTLIMVAVFGPVAMLGGLTGRFYQQFALTIAIAVLISGFNALSLSPALAALLLKPAGRESRGPFGWFRRVFNRTFDRTTNAYLRGAKMLARRAVISIVVVAAIGIVSGWLGRSLPTGLVPDEDQGVVILNIQLPNAASLARTDQVCRQIEAKLKNIPGVQSFNFIGGLSFLSGSSTPNNASAFIRLKNWSERTTPETKLRGIMARLTQELGSIPEAIIFPFVPPALPGVGVAGGFNFVLQDRTGTMSVPELGAQAQRFLAAANERPELQRLFTAFDPTVPQLDVQLDREKARKLGVPIPDVFATLQTALGGAYVNDFNRFGRLYRVFVQAEPEYRQKPSDISKFYVRSRTTGAMIPLSTLVTVTPTSGTELTIRYNLFRAVEISGSAAPGYSSSQAMQALEEVATKTLPPEMSYEFSGLSYQEQIAPNPLPTFLMAVVFVFLLLAALYESWALPWSVLLGTPFVVFGAFGAVWLFGFANNIFIQVGLIMLIGLAAKNAILIVEFAKQQREAGKDAFEAAVESARLRFRPILMTALSFILGVVPLVLATGSGAASRKMMGIAVFSGMLVATLMGVFFVPSLYVFIERLVKREKKPELVKATASPAKEGEA